jgi:hydrogenase nickel incorporation protein HypA/HybF
MHEAAICMSLLDLIGEQARREKFARVRRVVIEVGAMSHVEPGALAFAFSAASPGGVCDGAVLEIKQVPAQAYCMRCEGIVAISDPGEACPNCGGGQVMSQGGDELKLKELEVV